MIALTGVADGMSNCFFEKLNQEDMKDIFVVNYLNDSRKRKIFPGKNFYNYTQKTDFFNAVINRQIPNTKLLYILLAHTVLQLFPPQTITQKQL